MTRSILNLRRRCLAKRRPFARYVSPPEPPFQLVEAPTTAPASAGSDLEPDTCGCTVCRNGCNCSICERTRGHHNPDS